MKRFSLEVLTFDYYFFKVIYKTEKQNTQARKAQAQAQMIKKVIIRKVLKTSLNKKNHSKISRHRARFYLWEAHREVPVLANPLMLENLRNT